MGGLNPPCHSPMSSPCISRCPCPGFVSLKISPCHPTATKPLLSRSLLSPGLSRVWGTPCGNGSCCQGPEGSASLKWSCSTSPGLPPTLPGVQGPISAQSRPQWHRGTPVWSQSCFCWGMSLHKQTKGGVWWAHEKIQSNKNSHTSYPAGITKKASFQV